MTKKAAPVDPAERAELLALLMEEEGLAATGAPAPAIRERTGPVPLSFAQHRLWSLQRLAPHRADYNVSAAVRLHGPLDVDALRRALNEIVGRHESLRTRFPAEDGVPCQVVNPAGPLSLPLISLPDATQAELARFLREAARRPFDLDAAPPVRFILARLGPDAHVFQAVAHHIVCDGWSLGVLTRELAAFYGAFTGSGPVPTVEPPLQHPDFAVWQRERFPREGEEPKLAYWRGRLAGPLPVLSLPTDRPRRPITGDGGARCSADLSPELAARLEALGNGRGCTRFMTLLALYATLLHRYSGQDSVVVGTPVSDRDHPGAEGAIGLYLNTVPLHLRLGDDPSFHTLLDRVRETALEAFRHADVPLELILEAVRPERTASRQPLFQTLFVLQNVAVDLPAMDGLRVERLPVENGTAKFDLNLRAEETAAGVRFELEYATDLFDAATAEGLVRSLTVLARAVAVDAARPLSALPLMDPADRERALRTGVAGTISHARDACFQHLFEARAVRVADRPALVSGDEVLTYAELDRRANQLARFLLSLGAGPEMPVGILMERGAAVGVALLGVLKAGAAALPLNPLVPPERVVGMLSHAGAPILITDAERLSSIPLSYGGHTVALDLVATDLDRESDARLATPVRPEMAAYLIYTSGSTGEPKGVTVAHAQLLSYLHAAVARLGLSACRRFAHAVTFGADLGHTMLFPALALGGTLHVLTRRESMDPDAFAAAMERHRIDCIKLTPSHLRAFLAAGAPARVLPRRVLVLGGELLPAGLVATVARLAPGCRVFNHYGPTETTVGVTAGLVTTAALDHDRPLPVGRPLPNSRIYVLDRALEPVPPGVRGEVFVGGENVARGYRGSPALTAVSFLPDPFFPEPGSRMYRTGDVGRWLPDGLLEIVGREDRQVKVRGHRVELGEVEAVLARQPGVREAAVVPVPEPGGGTRLAAYVALQGGEEAAAELRAALRREMPDYMVPALVVPVERLPLLPSGKVDLEALPEAGAPAGAAPGVSVPASPTAQVVAAIWAEVLGVPHVGATDNFFDLGGHSILAIQAMSRIQKAFGVELPLVGVFEMPTVAELARHLETLGTAGTPEQPELVAGAGGAGDRLSFGQERLWFLHELDPESPAYNMAGVMRATGRLDVTALEAGFTAIVRRHQVLRTVYRKEAGRPVAMVLPPEPVAVEVVCLRDRPMAEREAAARHILADAARRPFRLDQGPLLRVLLVQTGDEEAFLLIAVHHIAADGWSVGLIIEEVAALYEAGVAHTTPALPPLPVQYADFAVWQREWMQGAVLEAQLNYWRDRLGSRPPVLELPADRPRPAVQSFRGDSIQLRIPLELTERLKAVARGENVTIFMLLVAAFNVLIHRYSGQTDVCVGTPVAGRDRRELEKLVGFFVNTLVLRTDLTGAPSFSALLARVREMALGAYAHQGVPFEVLVNELEPERDLGRTPLFQVMFVWHNIPNPRFQLRGLELAAQEVPVGGAKFDLTLALQEYSQGLIGSIEFATDLFDEATIRRLADHLRALLEGIATDPHCSIARLPLLGEGERGLLLSGWNDTATELGDDGPAHERFRAQVARSPDAVAAGCGGKTVTYAELDRRVQRLARSLAAAGVGSESVVAVLMERGTELLTAVLAIWEVGAAYLPLDPAHPTARHAQVLDRSGAVAVLAERPFLDAARRAALELDPARRPRVRSARALRSAGGRRGQVPARAVGDTALAYVIFTSGSTGAPKGAMVEHGGMLNHLLAKIETLGLGPTDVVAQTASQCFDISVWQLVAPLLVGARVEILPDDVAHDPARLLAAVRDRRVTVLETVPALLGALLEAGDGEAGVAAPGAASAAAAAGRTEALALRWLMPTGEALPPELARRWLERYPRIPLVNAYGPTECSDDVTQHVVVSAPADGEARVPIGRPLANTRLYVLDAHGEPVPPGVAGELYVGGAGVGRGYIRDPGRTAAAFLPDPFGPPGHRLYRTGDRARWRADGVVEFLGRVDHQLKLRGLRIEPGEIEAVLRRHPAVKEAVVAARDAASGEAVLVAWVVLASQPAHGRGGDGQGAAAEPAAGAGPDVGGAAAAATLREHLRERLPAYMVPAVFLLLGELPRLPNGKVDRNALPAPDRDGGGPDCAPAVAPRSLLEHRLAEIWGEVLRVPEVAITDNFFELGGHSLLAVRLMALVHDRLGRELPLSSLFLGPTVEHQAHFLRELPDPALWSPLVPVTTGGARRPFFAVHPTGGDVLCYYHLARLLGDRPFYAFQARGLDGHAEPGRSIPEMAACYVAALRDVQPQGPYALGGWSFGGVVAFEMARQLHQDGASVMLLAVLDSLAPVAPAEMEEARGLGQVQWARWFQTIAGEFERVLGRELELFGAGFNDFAGLEPEAQLERFLDRLATVDFLPPGAGRSMARGFWRVHEAHAVALWNYARIAGAHDGPVTLFRCGGEALLGESWSRELHQTRTLGWDRLAGAGLHVVDVPGDHDSLLSSPHVEELAGKLRACLEAVDDEAASPAATARAASGDEP